MPQLTVVIPTITGREESLQITIDSYESTLAGEDYDIVIIQDGPTWPDACNEGYEKSDSPYILFGADDLDAEPGWYWFGREALLRAPMELPAPRVFDNQGPDGAWQWANAIDGADHELTHFTRVPFMTREQWEIVGAWPSIGYYADMWVSEKAKTLGIRTRMVHGFDFFHRWSQIGRIDGDKAQMDEYGWHLNRLREEMV